MPLNIRDFQRSFESRSRNRMAVRFEQIPDLKDCLMFSYSLPVGNSWELEMFYEDDTKSEGFREFFCGWVNGVSGSEVATVETRNGITHTLLVKATEIDGLALTWNGGPQWIKVRFDVSP